MKCPKCSGKTAPYGCRLPFRIRTCLDCDYRFRTQEVFVEEVDPRTPRFEVPVWYRQAIALRHQYSFDKVAILLSAEYPNVSRDKVVYWIMNGRREKHIAAARERHLKRKQCAMNSRHSSDQKNLTNTNGSGSNEPSSETS